MMTNQDFKKNTKKKNRVLWLLFVFLIIGIVGLTAFILNSNKIKEPTKEKTVDILEFENGIHVATGFKQGEGLNEVIVSCTPCHSAKLVTQNRATKEGWVGIIRWMQATQNLWDLGDNETIIADYLAKHYAPEEMGRRKPLNDIEWYSLDN
tara:strand:+ start:15848 stop:16300 length:453 start_codon:yes stop_codon:yes gene_type:complete